MRFFMPMKPPTATAQEKKIDTRGDRPRVYKSQNWENARESLKSRLAQYRPKRPYDTATSLTVKWCFFDENGEHDEGEYYIVKPDTDNLDKGLKDIMTELRFWIDDAIVAEEHIGKYWSRYAPGIYIEIERL